MVDALNSPGMGAPEEAGRLRIAGGTCYALFAFDVGLAIDLDTAQRVIVEQTQRETISPKRRIPPYFQYQPAPIRVTQSCEPLVVAGQASAATVDSVIYDFGAMSITYRFPLEGSSARLLALSEALYDNRVLLAHSRGVAERLLKTIAQAVTKPQIAGVAEDFAIFQIEALEGDVKEPELLTRHGGELASILRSEQTRLSDQEVTDALSCRIAYGCDDLAILDWNAALLFDRDADDVRTVLEFANVELLEMRHLDEQLDRALEGGYRTVSRRRWRWPYLFDSPQADLRQMAELQVDNALLFEGVNNTLKLLGDQYLARVYRLAAQRLHLTEWDSSILRKLRTLESMYEKVSDLAAHRRAELLEWIIIILIAVELLVNWKR